jgi:uncharacterized protein YjbI with pentapeptide repeats
MRLNLQKAHLVDCDLSKATLGERIAGAHFERVRIEGTSVSWSALRQVSFTSHGLIGIPADALTSDGYLGRSSMTMLVRLLVRSLLEAAIRREESAGIYVGQQPVVDSRGRFLKRRLSGGVASLAAYGDLRLGFNRYEDSGLETEELVVRVRGEQLPLLVVSPTGAFDELKPENLALLAPGLIDGTTLDLVSWEWSAADPSDAPGGQREWIDTLLIVDDDGKYTLDSSLCSGPVAESIRPERLAEDLPALSKLPGFHLRNVDLSHLDLSWIQLSGFDLSGALLDGTNLQIADLREANLSGASLQGAQLQNADLGRAKLRGADLRGARLDNAALRGADLVSARLSGASFRGAELYDIQWFDKPLNTKTNLIDPALWRTRLFEAFASRPGLLLTLSEVNAPQATDTDSDRGPNCGFVAVSADSVADGVPFKGLAARERDLSGAPYQRGLLPSRTLNEAYSGRLLTAVDHMEAVRLNMLVAGDGARAIVVGSPLHNPEGAEHALNAFTIGNEVYFVDAQLKRVYVFGWPHVLDLAGRTLPEASIENLTNWRSVSFIRTDGEEVATSRYNWLLHGGWQILPPQGGLDLPGLRGD